MILVMGRRVSQTFISMIMSVHSCRSSGAISLSGCGVWVVQVGLKVKSSDEPAIVDECGWVGEGYVDVVVGLV